MFPEFMIGRTENEVKKLTQIMAYSYNMKIQTQKQKNDNYILFHSLDLIVAQKIAHIIKFKNRNTNNITNTINIMVGISFVPVKAERKCITPIVKHRYTYECFHIWLW